MSRLRARRRRRSLADEGGFTLVEQLVTIVLMGIGVTAVLGSILTLVSTSTSTSITYRDLSDAAVLIAASGERLSSPDTPLLSCATGEIDTVASVEFWNGSGFDGTCHEVDGFRAQKLTLRVCTGWPVVPAPTTADCAVDAGVGVGEPQARHVEELERSSGREGAGPAR